MQKKLHLRYLTGFWVRLFSHWSLVIFAKRFVLNIYWKCLLNLFNTFHHISSNIVHCYIHVTLCTTYLLNNENYNTCFLTVVLQIDMETSWNHYKNALHALHAEVDIYRDPQMTGKRNFQVSLFAMVPFPSWNCSVVVAQSRHFFNGCSKLTKNLLSLYENKLHESI